MLGVPLHVAGAVAILALTAALGWADRRLRS